MRKDYRKENRTRHFVKASGKERRELLKYLKERGFQSSDGLAEKEIRTSPYPLCVDTVNRKICVLAQAAMAAAAAANDAVLTAAEFYSVFE